MIFLMAKCIFYSYRSFGLILTLVFYPNRLLKKSPSKQVTRYIRRCLCCTIRWVSKIHNDPPPYLLHGLVCASERMDRYQSITPRESTVATQQTIGEPPVAFRPGAHKVHSVRDTLLLLLLLASSQFLPPLPLLSRKLWGKRVGKLLRYASCFVRPFCQSFLD